MHTWTVETSSWQVNYVKHVPKLIIFVRFSIFGIFRHFYFYLITDWELNESLSVLHFHLNSLLKLYKLFFKGNMASKIISWKVSKTINVVDAILGVINKSEIFPLISLITPTSKYHLYHWKSNKNVFLCNMIESSDCVEMTWKNFLCLQQRSW